MKDSCMKNEQVLQEEEKEEEDMHTLCCRNMHLLRLLACPCVCVALRLRPPAFLRALRCLLIPRGMNQLTTYTSSSSFSLACPPPC